MSERREYPEFGTVRILGLPLDLQEESRRHFEALLREFAFIVDGGGDNTDVPNRLLVVVDRVRAQVGGLNTEAEGVIEAAQKRGEQEVDVDLVVPMRLAGNIPDVESLLDEVDAYCRSGDLLTLAVRPEIRAFRRWYLDEVLRQRDGEPPMTWREWRARDLG